MYDTVMSTQAATDMHDDDSFALVAPSAYEGWEGEFSRAAEGARSEAVDAELLCIVFVWAYLVPLVGIRLVAERCEEGEGLEGLFEGCSVCDGFRGVGVAWRAGGWSGGDEGDVGMWVDGSEGVGGESEGPTES